MITLYGAAPFWPPPLTVPDPVPTVPDRFAPPVVVWPEDLARQLRELRESVDALKAGRGETTARVMARRVVEALIAADPDALAEIEAACAAARAAKEVP